MRREREQTMANIEFVMWSLYRIQTNDEAHHIHSHTYNYTKANIEFFLFRTEFLICQSILFFVALFNSFISTYLCYLYGYGRIRAICFEIMISFHSGFVLMICFVSMCVKLKCFLLYKNSHIFLSVFFCIQWQPERKILWKVTVHIKIQTKQNTTKN